MGKIGLRLLLSVLLLCALGLTSGELSKDVGTESASHRRNGEVSIDDIDRILKRLEDSETLTQRLLDRVDQLESRDQLQQEEIRNLQNALNRRNEKEASTKRRAGSRMLRDGPESPKIYSTIHRKPDKMNEDVSERSLPNSRIARIQNSVQQQRIRQLADNPTHVAFLATLSQHQVHIGVHQPVIFDNVITNIGNAYHNHLGSFIAPFQGTYVLSATLMSTHHTDSRFAFVKNGSTVTQILLQGSESGYSTSSQTVVLSLQQGDDVNIHNLIADKNVNGNDYSIFSGFLLFEDESPAIIG